MNGRLYDPIVGRMLSPDIYVQDPTYSPSYNRYSYVNNNPLKYTDPSGWSLHYEFFNGFRNDMIPYGYNSWSDYKLSSSYAEALFSRIEWSLMGTAGYGDMGGWHTTVSVEKSFEPSLCWCLA